MKIELKLTPQKIMAKVLETAQKIQDENHRAIALKAIAETLAAIAKAQAKAGRMEAVKIIAAAIQAAQKIKDPKYRALTLATITGVIAEKTIPQYSAP